MLKNFYPFTLAVDLPCDTHKEALPDLRTHLSLAPPFQSAATCPHHTRHPRPIHQWDSATSSHAGAQLMGDSHLNLQQTRNSRQICHSVTMKALINLGSLGRRWKPLPLIVPKPLVDFANKPAILYQIEALKATGVAEVFVVINKEQECVVEAGVRLSNCVLMRGACIKRNSCICSSIIGWNCSVGAWARVDNPLILDEDMHIEMKYIAECNGNYARLIDKEIIEN
ncbi:hypothetical protein Scep_021379 [Stephania cephalantha]|uniref:Mannose-1-phosphate guanyltransferase C-terminal domain-containing protein n=1 Tax=Stephania cephalantha TaxID=152367 RepID=A0AAP0I1G0_9MAGN